MVLAGFPAAAEDTGDSPIAEGTKMSDLDAILQEARQLGKKIAAHPRAKEFKAAAKAVAEDREAQDVLRSYQEIRSEEHTSELQSRFGISYPVFCWKKN